MEDYMLTTYDNPHDPFEDFDAWFKYDMKMGHNTCGLLANKTLSATTFGDDLDRQRTEEAMDEIVKQEPMIYKKVKRSDYKNNSETES
jgi:hypothetical protein